MSAATSSAGLVFGLLRWWFNSLPALVCELATLRDWRNRGLISDDDFAEHSTARVRSYRRSWCGDDAGTQDGAPA